MARRKKEVKKTTPSDLQFTPVNANERLMYGMLLRLDALCNMVNSMIEYTAEKEGVATENVKEKNLKEKNLKEKNVKTTRTSKK